MDRLGLFGQMQSHNTPVLKVCSALDESAPDQSVHDLRDGGKSNAKHLTQVVHLSALMFRDYIEASELRDRKLDQRRSGIGLEDERLEYPSQSELKTADLLGRGNSRFVCFHSFPHVNNSQV